MKSKINTGGNKNFILTMPDRRISVVLLALTVFVSCTKNFNDYNTDPNAATSKQLANDYIGNAIFITQMEKNVFPNAPSAGDASAFQVAQDLCADVFSGYLASPTPFASGRNNTNYALQDGWTSAYFNNELNNVLSGWKEIQRRDSADYPEIYAVGEIIKVLSMQRVTDLYGPMIYSKYGSGGFESSYDSQEDIYHSFFTDLDDAIAKLTTAKQKSNTLNSLVNLDLVYGGDAGKWIQFANSLKLRIAMRLSYVEPDLAKQKAEEAVASSAGMITLNSDNAMVQTYNGNTIYNPWYVISVNYDGDIRMSANMESFLGGYHDPREASYFLPSSEFQNQFRGVRNGIDIVAKTDRQGFSGLNVTLSSPIIWMTAAEVSFLKAEGVLRGWNMGGGTAQSYYENGIALSFNKEGISAAAAETYYSDDTSKPAPYADPVDAKNDVTAGSGDLSTITIKWNDADGFEKNLERIITQKWIAMYPEAGEAWSEFRRTGYPKVFPVVVNYSNGTIDTKTQIRRLPYPLSEYQNNSAEVNNAVKLLGGADNGGTQLWWDKKTHPHS